MRFADWRIHGYDESCRLKSFSSWCAAGFSGNSISRRGASTTNYKFIPTRTSFFQGFSVCKNSVHEVRELHFPALEPVERDLDRTTFRARKVGVDVECDLVRDKKPLPRAAARGTRDKSGNAPVRPGIKGRPLAASGVRNVRDNHGFWYLTPANIVPLYQHRPGALSAVNRMSSVPSPFQSYVHNPME